MANKIQFQRGTKARLAAHGPLDAGEPGYTTDTKELFIGNGTGANTPLVSATSADITYYVRTDGNDNNTGLANTAGGAFKTIGRAIGLIPQTLNHDVIVNVAAGTYAEDVIVKGKNGSGYLGIVGTSATVQSVEIARCQRVQIIGITATSTAKHALQGYDGGMIDFVSCRVTTSSANASGAVITNQKGIISGCTISNRGTAIEANNAEVAVVNCDGTGNTNAILPINSAVVTTGGTIPSGGILGNFRGVVNPWGDNTMLSRSAARGVAPTTGQTLSASVWTKLSYPQETLDNIGNYDPSTSRFTVTQTGGYLINASAIFLNVPPGGVVQLALYANGSYIKKLGFIPNTTGSAGSLTTIGSTFIQITAGDFIEIYGYSGTPITLSTGVDGLFEVVRVS